MSGARIEFHSEGFAALAKSPEILAECERRAEMIADAAGEGFEVRASVGKTRARAAVIASTKAARVAEATDKALTSALGAGRG